MDLKNWDYLLNGAAWVLGIMAVGGIVYLDIAAIAMLFQAVCK